MNLMIAEQLGNVLTGLKDFQLATVNRTLERYQAPEHSHRVLVADEVGLGKTIVAKGVIARLLQSHLVRETDAPMRVIYICSNLALADENRQKLALFKGEYADKWVKQPTFGRLVELAVKHKGSVSSGESIIEVCTLTPSTSFTLTAGAGNCRERAILAVFLSQAYGLKEHALSIFELFKTSQITREDRWEKEIKYIQNCFSVESEVVLELEARLAAPCELVELKKRFATLQEAAVHLIDCWVKDGGETENTSHLLHLFRTEVRRQVAQCCASSLKADLFILDEFQRFQSLTDQSSGSEESLIAKQVFKSNYDISALKPKVLLLSATPFKAMTTLNDEEDESSHHEQLHKLLNFLSKNNIDFVSRYEEHRDQLHRDMLNLSSGSYELNSISDANARRVESLLQEYICRTERSQISKGFDELVRSNELCCGSEFGIDEVKGYSAVEALNEVLPKGRGGMPLIDFAKSAPWCMSFLHGYAFKKKLIRNLSTEPVKKLLRKSKASDQKYAWLSRSDIQSYKLNVEQQAPNAKIKALSKVIFEQKPENLLWTPPCKPYYGFEGVFKNNEDFSKTLLFSSWALVPRALSCLWSYEAERRVLNGKGKKPDYFAAGSSSPLLRFEGKSTLNVWHLIYPCKSISDVTFSSQSFDEILEQQTDRIRKKLTALETYESEEKTNSDWYLLAPMLLDIQFGEATHVEQWLEIVEERSVKEGRLKHFDKIQQYLADVDSLNLGKMPSDLAKVLAYSSMANPALCAMRTIHRLWGSGASHLDQNREILSYSIQFAELVCKLFNHEYAIPIITRNIKAPLVAGRTASPGWYKALMYCAHGNFQSMLDEYCHLLSTSGCSLKDATDKLKKAMGIRSSSEHVHFWEDNAKEKRETSSSIRCHFAVPLGSQKLTDDSGLQRVVNVRDAFNSPFRPFVLSSTSIGQEGLDFHWYCRRVVHWNLPSNPIDIEQREGRVNRYKSFVVRKRIAESYSPDFEEKTDVWVQLFEQATKYEVNRNSDLEPYWFTQKGTAQIERIVPMYPMSKEVAKYADIKKILVLYRLAFGQPRQQELLDNLLQRNLSETELEKVKASLIINLAPLKILDEGVDDDSQVTCEAEVL